MDVNLFEAHARIATADGMPARLERTAASSVRIPQASADIQMDGLCADENCWSARRLKWF
jgi:hypothetical protein